MLPMAPRSAYVHIPFCAAKCGYCDFNSYAGLMPLAGRYVDALVRQIESASIQSHALLEKLGTIFYGGGTPSILPADQLNRTLNTLQSVFGLAQDCEITLEANPESATLGKLTKTREAGFNRISMGAQSFDDETLKTIGRVHTHERFLQALKDARRAGYDNVSFDLIFALPGQTLQNVKETILKAIDLQPDHISAYCLTIEEDTDFHTLYNQGLLQIPDEDLQSEMFLTIREALCAAGFEHYEISNYAKPGFHCRHNEVYWRNEPYWGFGTGAVGFVDGWRTKWETNPQKYIEQIEETGKAQAVESENLDKEALIGETAMLALRTAQGLDLKAFSARFQIDSEKLFHNQIARFTSAGLLSRTNGHVSLTPSGQLLANEILAEFLI